MNDLLKAWRCLQVTVKEDDKGVNIVEYSYVWTGSNGQQSRCSFVQGSEAVLLPPDGYSKSDLIAIVFYSVQLKGKAIGKVRFKVKDSGEQSEVSNAAVGHRLISAYLLQHGLMTEDDIATAFCLTKVPKKRTANRQAEAQPVSKTVEQLQRAKHDDWHEDACKSLAQHPDWYVVSSEVNEEGQRAHRVIKLSAAADRPEFGKTKYRALRKRSWKLCAACPGIFVDSKRLERHRCAAEEIAAMPENVEQAAAEAAPATSAPALMPAIAEHTMLPGGLLVRATMPQVTYSLSVL